MSGIINQAIQTAMQMTLSRVQGLSSALATGSGAARSRSFVQWLDFNRAGHVQHLHVQYLEWLYGSVYRKHTRHVLLLYNFDVNQSNLKGDHIDALEAFTKGVVFPQFLNASRGRAGFGRHFEYYENPFAVNVSRNQKQAILSRQAWIGGGSREDALKYKETGRYLRGGSLRAPFDRLDSFFPAMDGSVDPRSLEGVGANGFVHYEPFLVDKLFNLGPADDSAVYPFEMIVGHASATGSDAQNEELSQQRAEAAVTQLHALLNDHCAEFDMVDPALRDNVEARGSRDPIWGDEDEVDENRSVELVFQTAYDYIHLQDEAELYDAYDAHVAIIREGLQEYIDEGRAARRAVNSGAPVELNFRTKRILDQAMRNADHRLALGMSTLKFCRRYQGDFSTLRSNAGLANLPTRANSPDFFKYRTPESRTSPRMLPLPFILQFGRYGESRDDDYKLPVSPKDKVAHAASALGDYIQEYAPQLVVSIGEVILPGADFDTMGEVLQHDYGTFYGSHPIIAHSFLLTEINAREDFEAALDNQDTDLAVPYGGDDWDVNILHYRFVTDTMKESNASGPWYWYDQGVLSVQVATKSNLAPLVLEATQVYQDLVSVYPEAAGMHLEQGDSYYLMETYFWIGDAK